VQTGFAKMNRLDWNDLRYVVAIARHGSAAAAARALEVSHATVLRRIQALEQGMGAQLFERWATGYEPTDAGKRLVEVGSMMETALIDTTRQIDADAQTLTGNIRFTTTDSFAYCLMPEILAGFRARYPAIHVDMIVTNTRLDLDKREADVTLRPSAHPPESWVGLRAGRADFGLYASHHYLESRGQKPLGEYDWLLPGGELTRSAVSQWAAEQAGKPVPVMTTDSFVGLRSLAQLNLGATVLPCYMAQPDSGLTLIELMPAQIATDIWVLTHENFRHTPHIQAFIKHIAQALRNSRHILEPGQTEPLTQESA
jgi:molybdate transport repressor ModE-like protein